MFRETQPQYFNYLPKTHNSPNNLLLMLILYVIIVALQRLMCSKQYFTLMFNKHFFLLNKIVFFIFPYVLRNTLREPYDLSTDTHARNNKTRRRRLAVADIFSKPVKKKTKTKKTAALRHAVLDLSFRKLVCNAVLLYSVYTKCIRFHKSQTICVRPRSEAPYYTPHGNLIRRVLYKSRTSLARVRFLYALAYKKKKVYVSLCNANSRRTGRICFLFCFLFPSSVGRFLPAVTDPLARRYGSTRRCSSPARVCFV